MRIRFGWLACVLVLGLARPALCQGPALGSVRVVLSGDETALGELVSATPDSVVILSGQGERLSYPRSAIRRLDVRAPGRRMDNAAIGAAIGGVAQTVGMVIIVAAGMDLQKIFLTTLFPSLGMVAGSFAPRGTRWAPRPLPKVSVSGHTVEVGFSLSVP